MWQMYKLWLYILYGIAWTGYLFLAFQSNRDESGITSTVVWRETPQALRYAEGTVGAISWIILGIYIYFSSDYDVTTLVLFFISQYGYILTMLWEIKQLKIKKRMGNGPTIALYTFLFSAVLFLLMHLFLGGTYGWMILIVRIYCFVVGVFYKLTFFY